MEQVLIFGLGVIVGLILFLLGYGVMVVVRMKKTLKVTVSTVAELVHKLEEVTNEVYRVNDVNWVDTNKLVDDLKIELNQLNDWVGRSFDASKLTIEQLNRETMSHIDSRIDKTIQLIKDVDELKNKK